MRSCVFVACFACVSCAPLVEEPPASFADPSDDPADYDVDTSVPWEPVLSEPRFVIPGDGLPDAHRPHRSNNNVAIEHFEGALFLAWRTAPTHFADDEAEMHVVRSTDGGASFTSEAVFALGSDVREPQLFVMDGALHLTFFQAGTNKLAFEPRALWRTQRAADGSWAALSTWGRPAIDGEETHEVPWDLKVRGKRAWLTSYTGGHYDFTADESALAMHLQVSDDGLTWQDVGAADVYVGGASEAAFEFDDDGSLWSILRNEDGDASGFGSLLCHADAASLAEWACPSDSDPERYDSPKMLRHGDELFIVARRDIGGPFDQGEDERPLDERRTDYNAQYWNRPKRTALYRVDEEAGAVVHVFDFPSAGDTAFPSIRRTGAHSFLIANYTSDLGDPDRTWLEGQEHVDGTSIYLIDLRFEER